MKKQFANYFSVEVSLLFIAEDAQRNRTNGTVTATHRQKLQDNPTTNAVFLTLLKSRYL